MFAGQFVRHCGNAGTVNTDAGTHRVDALVATHHRNFGALAGITGRRLDFHDAFFDFRHFKFKELLEEVGARAGQNDLLTLRVFLNAQHHGTHTVAVAQVFTRNHFRTGQQGIQTPDFHDCAFLHHALHGTVDDFFVTGEEFAENLFAFRVTQALQNDLFGILSKTTTGRINVFNRLFNVVTHLDAGVVVFDVREHFLAIRFLQPFVTAHHKPATDCRPVARVLIDRHHDVRILTGELRLLHRARKRRFQHAEHGSFFHIFFIGQNIDHIEHVAAHYFFPLKSSSAIRLARSTSAKSNVTTTGAAAGAFFPAFLPFTASAGVRAM